MKKPPRQISVRAETYALLKELARKNGEQLATTVDGLVRRWLDEQEKTS